MSKKIIICSPELGIALESNSGGEVYDREVIKAFCQQGIKVIVILPKNKPYIPHKNLKVYYLPFPFVWPPYLFNFFIIPYLFYIYKKHKFNILRVHSPYFVGLGALFFKIFYPSVPLIATYHHLEEKKPFFDLINKLFIKKWNKIIVVSKFTKNEIIKNYQINPKKIKVIYNGINKKFKPQKRNQKLVKKYKLTNKKILLFLGGLKKRKNVGFLLKLMLKIRIKNAVLLICGKGALLPNLINQTKKLNINNKVIFTGFVPEKEKVDYYNLADILLHPAKKEGFGMTIIEAGACGIPSVASNTSSLKELIINGKTGYLAKLNNIKDWQKKVEKLLKDEKLRKKMGKQAQKFSCRFSWQKCVKSYP